MNKMTTETRSGPDQLVDQIVEMKRLLGQFAQLIEISLSLNSTLEQDLILQSIIETASQILDCEAVSILLYDDNLKELNYVASTNTAAEEISAIHVPLENSIAGTIFTLNKPQIINAPSSDPGHYQLVNEHLNLENKTLVGVPMRIRDRAIGVLEGINKRDGEFTAEDVDILLVIANQAAVAINNAQMMESVQMAFDELSRIDKIKSNFINIVSHELRTPLFHILGYAQMLEQDAEGESAENLQKVLKSARLLQALVEDMTDMNMLEVRSGELEKEKLVLQDLLLEAYQEIAASAEDKKIETKLALPNGSISVMGDAEKLKYVFVNVYKNAVKYTPEGGQIQTAIDINQNMAHITIQDTGIGIPQKELESIFDRFRQIEEHLIRNYGGLGLGLSIARGVIELHEGKIWAESQGKDKGATFHITLPLEVVPPFLSS